MSQTIETKREAFPSHGRGRRFNPYSAHHFADTLGGIDARSIGAKSLQSVHDAYKPLKDFKPFSKPTARGRVWKQRESFNL
jgi:hypothetical protein